MFFSNTNIIMTLVFAFCFMRWLYDFMIRFDAVVERILLVTDVKFQREWCTFCLHMIRLPQDNFGISGFDNLMNANENMSLSLLMTLCCQMFEFLTYFCIWCWFWGIVKEYSASISFTYNWFNESIIRHHLIVLDFQISILEFVCSFLRGLVLPLYLCA